MGGDKIEDIKESAEDVTKDAKRAGERIKDSAKRKYEDKVEDVAHDTKRAAEDVINKGKGTFESIRERVGETIEEARETISEKFQEAKEKVYDTAQDIKDKIVGEKGSKIKDTIEDTADNFRENVRDAARKTKRKSDDIGDTVKDTYENLKESVKEKTGDLYEKGQRTVKEGIDSAEKVWEGVSRELRPLYEQGWEKLELLVKHGKFNFDELKDLFGGKLDEINEKISKPGSRSDRDRGIIGKRKEDNVPDRLRDFYDLMWHKIDEVFENKHIKLEDLMPVFGEKTEDLKKMINRFAANDFKLDKKTRESIDEEIDRVKSLILGWKDKLADTSEHKKNLWENIRDSIKQKWSEVKEKVVPSREEAPSNAGSKSSDL